MGFPDRRWGFFALVTPQEETPCLGAFNQVLGGGFPKWFF